MAVSRKRITLLIAGLLVVAALTAGVLTSRDDAPPEVPDPERVLRSYFEAARTGRVDEALRIAGVERPTGPAAAFLDATSSDWRVDYLQLLGQVTDTARFGVRIERPGDYSAGSDVTLRRHGSGWRIEDPLVAVTVPLSPLWYVEVNGTKVPREGYDADAARQRYLLLPGMYDFYRDQTVAKIKISRFTALPGMADVALELGSVGSTSTGAPIPVSLTEAGGASATQLVNAHLDQCAARPEPVPIGCPFGAPSAWSFSVDGHYVSEVQGTWTVLTYPLFDTQHWFPDSFQVVGRTAEPGRVRLSGTGSNSGTRVPFTLECTVDLTQLGLLIGVTADGTVTLDYYDRRYLGYDDLPAVSGGCDD